MNPVRARDGVAKALRETSMSPLRTARELRVGIVGGSVAGSITAAELVRLGADVAVFERSRHIEDRGAGIGLALSLV